MAKPGPNVTSEADDQPGANPAVPTGFGTAAASGLSTVAGDARYGKLAGGNTWAGTQDFTGATVTGIAGGATVSPASVGYDIVIAAGQSNMVGDATIAAPDTRYDVPDARVWSFDQSGTYANKVASAVEPLPHPNGTQGVGPAFPFARWYALANPGRRVLIVPVAVGGTALTGTGTPRWDATLSGSLFDQMVTAALAAKTAAGANSTFAACLWLQGENDGGASVPMATYRDALVTLIDDLRVALTAHTLPFLICSMAPEVIAGGAAYQAIDTAHQAIPALRQYTSYTAGASGQSSGLHYTAAGQRINGRNLLTTGLPAASANTAAPASPLPGPDTTAPSTPTGLAATPGDTQVALAWSASTDDVRVTGYRVRRGGTIVGSPAGTSYTDTGLTNATLYSYTVSALDAAGNESPQTSAVTATPAAGAGTSETWTGSNGAAWPGQWTTGGGTFTIQSNKGRLNPTSFYAAGFMSGATAITGDFDLTVTWSMAGQTGNTSLRIGMAHALPAGPTPVDGYTFENIVTSGGVVGGLILNRYDSSSATSLGSAFPSISAGANGFTTRVQRTGSTVQAKTWTAGASEPGTWNVSVTDGAPVSTTLKVCLALEAGSGVTVDFDNLTLV